MRRSTPKPATPAWSTSPSGAGSLSDVITLDRDTNINLMPFVAPESRRDRRIYDADIKRAFEQTKRYDLVIVAAMDHADPSLRFFAGMVDHIVLVASADDFNEAAAEQFIARRRARRRARSAARC